MNNEDIRNFTNDNIERPMAQPSRAPAPEPVEDDFDLGDDFGLPEIELPEEGTTGVVVDDDFKGAVRYAFVGVGHGGSRIAETFYKLGYNRVFAVNTSAQDLAEIDLPDKDKLCLEIGGAGKDRAKGYKAIKDNYENILEGMRKSFGSEFDRIIVCATSGGGTGSGGFEVILEIADALTEELRIKSVGADTRVGLILALPFNSEKGTAMQNAYECLRYVDRALTNKFISPFILVDNEKIFDLFPSVPMGKLWKKANDSLARNFHLFNKVSVAPTKFTAFDPIDYASVLDSGAVTFGSMAVKGTDETTISKAFRDNMTKNVLTGGLDLKTASVCGCIMIGDGDLVNDIPAKNLDKGFEMLERVIGGGTVHRGIYAARKQPLAAYTIIGGLQLPAERLKEVARYAGKEQLK